MKNRAVVAVMAVMFLLGTKPIIPQHKTLSHHTLEGNPLPYPPPEPGPPWWCIFEPPTYPGCVLPVV
jgi:hypothetical protein